MNEPTWLQRAVVLALHDRMLAEFGGASGLRDTGPFESALARPRQAFSYGVNDIPTLAASYAVGIIQEHPFLDGNKRTGFLCAVVFMEINGWRFSASEPDVVIHTLALAASELNEDAYAAWLKANSHS
jgi:death-on-curing protein